MLDIRPHLRLEKKDQSMSDIIYLARADGQVIGKFTEEELRAKQGLASALGIDAFWLENIPTTPVSVTLTLSAWMPSG